jgi:hypothetical protein
VRPGHISRARLLRRVFDIDMQVNPQLTIERQPCVAGIEARSRALDAACHVRTTARAARAG